MLTKEDLLEKILEVKRDFIKAGHTNGEWVIIFKFGIRQGWGYKRIKRMMRKKTSTTPMGIKYWLTLLKTTTFTPPIRLKKVDKL